ncbi:LysR family transcriptional regulator [Shewanella sp. D64]|uniref:LysR family transcriptional regulator n=1 Tax=unclassified Shewanella TaxID=196818 RepID=UPI0022BA58CD|nr:MULTISPECIES: LysR family transcriptional regulator [unclassified Shewanella]MEC4727440.1 LysR family transcriptional regulator [Shewanella sp. D64]MEC4739595.1 LysR family transcriptional regulator [Shewanella sp. E94]WBJ96023.1 LysR family transcriptional regulator [Shewanella sp. MTB7]
MFIKNEQRRLAYQMLVFDEVIKKGSFTAAAESLGHTKSAVSQYVSQLEAALGVRLLNRSTRQLNLTVVGQLLAKRSEQLLDLLMTTVEEVKSHELAPVGRIAITAPHAFESSLVTPIVAQLCYEYPKLVPELVFSDERLDLLQNNLDIAISVGPQKDSAYHAILIGKLDSILVASSAYLARNSITGPSLNLQHLVVLPWQQQAVLESRHGGSILFHSDKQLKVNTSISGINSVKCGVGVGLMPSIFVEDDLASGQLQRVLPDYQGKIRDVYALHSYQQQLPLVLRRFVERLKMAFGRVSGLGTG